LAAARAFGLWNKAGGKTLAGLTRRRNAEAALYLEPSSAPAAGYMPQRVDPETQPLSQPITVAQTVAGGTAGLAVVSEVARAIAGVKNEIASLGDWLVPALLCVTLAAVVYTVYQRWLQRRGGWA
jgi:lysozyme